MKYEYDFALDDLDIWLNDIDWNIVNIIDEDYIIRCSDDDVTDKLVGVTNKLKFEYISGPYRIYAIFQRTVFPCHIESIESLESIL